LRLFDPNETSRRRPGSGAAGRLTPASTSHAMPHEPMGSGSSFARSESPSALQADLHPAIAGHLAAEGYGVRPRRPSVRIRFTETWESSSKFRYLIVIVSAAVLAAAAVIGGFALAG
jgi:hypothetical protein